MRAIEDGRVKRDGVGEPQPWMKHP